MNYVYFDFDGTIADSFKLGIEIFNNLAPRHNLKTLDMTKIDYYKSLSAQEMIKEFEVPLIRIPILAPIFKIEMKKRIDELQPAKGVTEMLEKLSKKQFIGILTSNTVDNVDHFLVKYDLKKYVSDVRSEFQVFGKHKSIKRIIKFHKIKKKQIIYVGDETRDIEASNKARIKSVAVTWGFNSEKALKKFNPLGIANSTNDIIYFVNKHFE